MDDKWERIHSLLPQYDPRTYVRNFRVLEDYKTIRSNLLGVGVLYEDYVYNVGEGIEWKRPKEICKKPLFIKDKPSRFDALQGEGENCWVASGIVALTTNDELVQWVVPPDQNFGSDYMGAFHFRIWKLGTWFDVVVDDRIPFDKKTNKLFYMHSKSGDVFWACLLEKAYAKFCGSSDYYYGPVNYKDIDTGHTLTVIQTFSGGIAEMIRETDVGSLQGVPVAEYLRRALSHKALICCMFKDNLGWLKLKDLHTYCINKVYKCTKDDPDYCGQYLIRIMNPWGEWEWESAWSDKDWRMEDRWMRKKLGLEVEEDGEFWMGENDFLQYFHKITICHTGPNQFLQCLGGTQYDFWRVISYRGEWVKSISDGGSPLETRHKNQICRFKLERNSLCKENLSTVVIDMTHWSKVGRRDWIFIGFYVYSISSLSEEDKDDLHFCTDLRRQFVQSNKALNESELDFQRSDERALAMTLKLNCPDEYVVIPCTEEPGFESQFLVRVFTDSYNNIWENRYAKIAKAFLVEESVLDEKDNRLKILYDRIANTKDEIDWKGLKHILVEALNYEYLFFDHILRCFKYIWSIIERFVSSEDYETKRVVFSKEECRSMIAMLDVDESGKLDYTEFKNLWNKIRFWTEVYERHKDETEGLLHVSQLRDALGSIGYDVDTRTVHSLTYIYANKLGLISLTDFILCGVNVETVITRYKTQYVECGKGLMFNMEDWVKNVLVL